jgi:hypothetical protein
MTIAAVAAAFLTSLTGSPIVNQTLKRFSLIFDDGRGVPSVLPRRGDDRTDAATSTSRASTRSKSSAQQIDAGTPYIHGPAVLTQPLDEALHGVDLGGRRSRHPLIYE